MDRIAALMGVTPDTVTDYHQAAIGSEAITAVQSRRDDGFFYTYRVTVTQIAEAAARTGGRKMTPPQCAVVMRWVRALLSDPDVQSLGPDDRWRLVTVAANNPDGDFYASRIELAEQWGLSESGTKKVIARMRKAGVLRGTQISRKPGVCSTLWTLAPVAAAAQAARARFEAARPQKHQIGDKTARQGCGPESPARCETVPAEVMHADQGVCDNTAGQGCGPESPTQDTSQNQPHAQAVVSVVGTRRTREAITTPESSKIPSQTNRTRPPAERVPAEAIDRILAAVPEITGKLTDPGDRIYVRAQIAETLRTGLPVQRLIVRVRQRWSSHRAPVNSPAGWFTRRALADSWGCVHADCEDGTIWHSGQSCPPAPSTPTTGAQPATCPASGPPRRSPPGGAPHPAAACPESELGPTTACAPTAGRPATRARRPSAPRSRPSGIPNRPTPRTSPTPMRTVWPGPELPCAARRGAPHESPIAWASRRSAAPPA
ncbi:hypothetical protein ACH4TC_18710 [Streptomyces spororaveus]|uniref:hypothetical protein n=1 Tax=Streptomyces spororaveus TaxID=284039 RepID=UPI0037B8BC07